MVVIATVFFCEKNFFNFYFILEYGLPTWLIGKESAYQCRRCRFNPLVGKIPWRRKGQPTPVFLPGESQGLRSQAGYRLWGSKNRTQLSD